MEIVPTSVPKKREIGLDELLLRKAELRQQIQDQELLISSSARKLVSPASITSYIFGAFKNNYNLVDGILLGLKIAGKLKRFFRNFR